MKSKKEKEQITNPSSDTPKLSKYRKQIIITIIIVLLILTIIIGAWGLLKAKLLVDEDIIVNTNITYSALNLKHGETTKLLVKNEITTTFLCEAQCSISLKRIDNNEVVYSHTEIVKDTYEVISPLNFTADKLGYGQELYSYQISCKNMYSNICPAPDAIVKKTALISLNYAPNDLELEAKGQLEKNLAKIINNLITTSSLTAQNTEYYTQLNLKNKTKFIEQNTQIEKAYSVYKQFINNLNKDTTDYLKTNQKIESANLLSRTNSLKQDANSLNQELLTQINEHNYALNLLSNITKEKQLLDELSLTENINKLTNKTTNLNHYLFIENQTNKIILSFNNNSIYSYNETIQEIQTILKTIQEIKNDYTINFKSNYVSTLLTLKFLETELCIVNNQIEDCRTIISLNSSNIPTTTNESDLTNDVLLNSNQCALIKNITSNNKITKEIQDMKREELSESELEKIDLEKLFIDYSLIQFLTRETNTRSINLPTNIQIYKNTIIQKLNDTYNTSIFISTDYYPDKYNNTLATLAIPLTEEFENNLTQMNDLCDDSYEIKLDFLNNHGQVIDLLEPVQIKNANYTIKDIPPICCAYNFCYTCSSKSDNLEGVPLLLLHGHSFYTKHTPDYSTNIFSNMLTKLETDEKYIPGGSISSDKSPYTLTKAEFGKNPVPLAAKGTYYYVTLYDGVDYIPEISKSENIDTYAIRLRDVIDELKYITGKQKIDVVAHSMGGLVLRRYMQLFGDESINKAILVGTPNHGLNDRIYEYCKLLGYEKECEDMHYNSSLLKTLNDPNNQPSLKKIYTIIGTGCGMDDDAQGDGIVTIESASLNNSQQHIVNGTCPLTNFPLHNELVNPEKYPEVYNIIEEILESK